MRSKQSKITRILIIALIVITTTSMIAGCNSNNEVGSETINSTASLQNTTEQITSPKNDETTDAGTNIDSNDPTVATTSPTEETSAPTVANQEETGVSDPNNGNDGNADNTETEGNQNETTQPTTPNDGGEGGNTDTGNNPAQGEDKKPSETEPIETKPVETEPKETEPAPTEPKPTEPPKSWSTAPGTRPYEYQEVFSILDFERCGIYQHCDRYGNVWIDRSPSSNGYGKTIYSNWLFNSDLHYYGDGVWSNFGAWWSEDGSRSGGSFSMTLGAATFSDIGSGEYVAPYGPQETVSSYIQACANALVGYETIMSNETWSDEQKANEVAAYFAAMGVKEADVIGYRDNPTTHPFPGVG